MLSQSSPVESGHWAQVELFGHKVLAGFVSKDETYGAPMLRVDVPAVGDEPAFTQAFGLSAIYSITPVSEELARKIALACKPSPVAVYVPNLRALPAGYDDADDPETDDDDNYPY